MLHNEFGLQLDSESEEEEREKKRNENMDVDMQSFEYLQETYLTSAGYSIDVNSSSKRKMIPLFGLVVLILHQTPLI